MEAHVRVTIKAARDMNTDELYITIDVDACEDMPDPLVMPTAVEAVKKALPRIETATLREAVRDIVTRTIEKLEEAGNDGSTDAGEPG